MEKFILNCTVERDICEPQVFNTYEEARTRMMEEFLETTGYKTLADFEKDYDENAYESWFQDWEAWCTSKNHNNCDWKISVAEV